MAVVMKLLLATVPTLLLSGDLTFAQEDLSCDIQFDVNFGTCPTLNNGVCDRETNPEQCAGLDCQDCDECQERFDYDCIGCVANGCFYCPADGTCRNTDRLSGGGLLCSREDWIKDQPDICTANVEDPLEAAENWAYELVNVRPVWNRGIFGAGVRVRVNDNGVASNHPEFNGRFDEAASCAVFEAETGTGTKGGVNFSHGTSVAGIIGAARGNGICSAGFAPQATISSCSVFEPGIGTTVLGDQLDSFDISNNSFGSDGCAVNNFIRKRRLQECPFEAESNPCAVCDFSENPLEVACQRAIQNYCIFRFEDDVEGCTDFLDIVLQGNCDFVTLSAAQSEALSNGITQGRDGKGIIWVFASGNAYASGDDTNFQGFTSSRFVISVASVGIDGLHSSFSTPGAGVFIAAPGGDSGVLSAHVTATVEDGCGDSGPGTSFAAPVVSGVVALILEANPDLTWRDVQQILAETARRVDEDPDDPFATVNAAGFWYSNFYGFGIIDADAAVQAAASWTLISREIMVAVDSGILNLPIADDENSPTSTTITFNSGRTNFVAESVNVQLDLDHSSRGHLEVVLTSPQGTRSILTPGSRPEDTNDNSRFKLLSLGSWGENPDGDWTLTITDTKVGDVESNVGRQGNVGRQADVDQLTQFTLVVYGRQVGDTAVPSSEPSLIPSSAPSTGDVADEPSTLPSSEPSLLPSFVPSLPPSFGPSVADEEGEPSGVPSIEPSGIPSTIPSVSPSLSNRPTEEFGEPSSEPSLLPSVDPSFAPSAAPSEALLNQSQDPTQEGGEQSPMPSLEPSISTSPTTATNERPTLPFRIERGNLFAVSRPAPAERPTIAPVSRPTQPGGPRPDGKGKGKGKGQKKRQERRKRREERGKGTKKSGKGESGKGENGKGSSKSSSEAIDDRTEAILRLIASRMEDPESLLSQFSRLIVRN